MFNTLLSGCNSAALQIVILITDGDSADSVEDAAVALQDAGVTVFAVGTYGSDEDLFAPHQKIITCTKQAFHQ